MHSQADLPQPTVENVVTPHVAASTPPEITCQFHDAHAEGSDAENRNSLPSAPVGNVVTPYVAASSPPEITYQVNETYELSALQCPACFKPLCHMQDLCFFERYNIQGGHEVHLIVKPELEHLMPPAFVEAPVTTKGARLSWQCTCGHDLGDTRPVGPKKAAMTAFKSASVMLCGQHHPGKKSKWPTLYRTHPFSDIEVRSRAAFHGQ